MSVKDFLLSNEVSLPNQLLNVNVKDDFIYGILDQYTGESITAKKITDLSFDPNLVDNIIYFSYTINNTTYYYKRVYEYITPQMFGAIGDGDNDDTSAFQNAINFLSTYGDTSAETGTNKIGGKLYVPEGVYAVKQLTIKSNIRIEGANCYSTRFQPIDPEGVTEQQYVFNTTDTNTIARMMYVTFENFTISPNDSYTGSAERSLSGGINLSYCESIKLDNIIMMCLGGPALNQVENYDCNITDCTFKFCNSISFLSGKDNPPPLPSDATNAVHISGCRFEVINQIKLGDGKNQQREINFSTSKFEGAYININGASSITFATCHFTPYNDYAIKINSVPADPFTDSRGISLSSCSFLSPTGETGRGIENVNGVSVSINGCTASNIETFVYGGNFNISNCILFDCTIPQINGYLMLVANSSIVNTRFAHINGNTNNAYPLRLYGSCQISNCVFEDFSHGVLSVENYNSRIAFNRFVDNKENQIKVTDSSGNVFLNNIGGTFANYPAVYDGNQITENYGVQIPVISSQKFGSMRYTRNTKELYINTGETLEAEVRIIDEKLLKVDQRDISNLMITSNDHTLILSRVGFQVSIAGEITLDPLINDSPFSVQITLPYKPNFSYILENNSFKFSLDRMSYTAIMYIESIPELNTYSFIFNYQSEDNY